MAERTEEEEEMVVVMFPFMAQGHMIPYLALALQVEQRFGYKIIFINTPQNIKKLHSSLPPTSTISLTELPFSGTDHGLPPDSENTDTLSKPLMLKLFQASLTLKPSFNQLILNLTNNGHGHPPLCIISDMFLGWTYEIARELNIFHAVFNTSGAYGMAIHHSMWMNLPHCKTVCDEFEVPDFPEVSAIHRSQLPDVLKNANGDDDWSAFNQRVLSVWFKSDGIMFNSLPELDHIGMKYFRRKMDSGRLWSILPGLGYQKKCTISPLEQCIEWLNKHTPDSVLFVSFGSQNTVSRSQMMELAIGLEQSGENFIWVVRPPLEFDINEEFRSEWLPEGYESRMKEQNRGLIVRKWAPQLEILAHKSTCAFLSHCGWNSVLESLSHGVPILGWPLSAEQNYNSKLLEEETGVCIEIGRGNSCEIRHENVTKAIQIVMGESRKGVEMRKRACDVMKMIKDAVREDEGYKGSSVRAIEYFMNAALSMRKENILKITDNAVYKL